MQFVRGELCSSVCFKFSFLTEEKKEEEEEDIIKKYYIFSTTRNDGMRRDPPLLWDRDSFSTFSSRRQYRGIDVTSVTFRSSPSLPVKYGGYIPYSFAHSPLFLFIQRQKGARISEYSCTVRRRGSIQRRLDNKRPFNRSDDLPA